MEIGVYMSVTVVNYSEREMGMYIYIYVCNNGQEM